MSPRQRFLEQAILPPTKYSPPIHADGFGGGAEAFPHRQQLNRRCPFFVKISGV
jgi:hypothetical protein